MEREDTYFGGWKIREDLVPYHWGNGGIGRDRNVYLSKLSETGQNILIIVGYARSHPRKSQYKKYQNTEILISWGQNGTPVWRMGDLTSISQALDYAIGRVNNNVQDITFKMVE